MLLQFQNFLTFENIYLWVSFGVMPLWIMMIFIPSSKLTGFFVNSIIIPLIIASAYIYVVYQIIILNEPIFDAFKLYLSLENLYTLFSNEGFLLVFWLHFIAINLFLGNWIAKDAVKYNISKTLVSAPLLLTYFMGPVGLVFYWMIRIFYAKKLSFHD